MIIYFLPFIFCISLWIMIVILGHIKLPIKKEIVDEIIITFSILAMISFALQIVVAITVFIEDLIT